MKLILCRSCQDVFKLSSTEIRFCACGKCSGLYLDDNLNARYYGEDAIPIGFANSSLASAIKSRPEDGQGFIFTAFVIPKKCDTFKLSRKKLNKDK